MAWGSMAEARSAVERGPGNEVIRGIPYLM